MAEGRKTGGRKAGTPNKITAPIKALAQEHTEKAIATLVSIMEDLGQPAAARVAAIKEILDRGHGKSSQVISGDPDGAPIKTETRINVRGLSEATLREIATLDANRE